MSKDEKGLDKLLNTVNVKKHDPDVETVECFRRMAWMTKIKYDALLKEGFNPDHAIELCKNLFSVNNQS